MSTRPTRARFILVLWLCGMAGVLYLDRICMSQAAKPIAAELGLTNTQLSYVHMAFTLAYGLFEIPTGRLGDRYGSRAVLTRIVVCWSLFTALTGAAWGLASLLIIRFLFGAGEAGAFPNAARVISRWFPSTERGRVQGLMLTTALVFAAAAPTFAAYLIDQVGWRWTFVVFGVAGIIWANGFWWWFRDDPAEHPGVNSAEVQHIQAGGPPPERHAGSIPWAAVARTPGFWLLGLAMISSAFNSYLYYSWFPTYLQEARGLDNIEAGWLSSLVLAGSAVGMLTGGLIADRISRGSFVVWGRRLLGGSAFLAAAGCLFAAVRTESPTSLAALAAVSAMCTQITLPTWWSAAIEQSGRHVGALFGLLNMMGTVGALSSQWFVGAFADWRKDLGYAGREQWDPMFNVYIIVLLIGALSWLAYRKRPLE